MKRRRKELKLTQADVASKVGIARSTYTNIERGQKNPSFAILLKIKEVLQVNSDAIFMDTKDSEGKACVEGGCR